jgi:hypothetical protein
MLRPGQDAPPRVFPQVAPWEINTGPLTHAEFMRMPVTVDLLDAAPAFGVAPGRARELARAGRFPCPVMRFGTLYRVSVPMLVQAPDVRVRELRRLMVVPAESAA